MSRKLVQYLLPLLFAVPVCATPILGPSDGNGYQLLLSDFPDPPQTRMPTAEEMEGLEAALYDYFSGFDWFFGPIGWQVRDSNSSGIIVGSAGGGHGAWATDFIYSEGVISSSLLDMGILWDINESGLAAGGVAGSFGYLCQATAEDRCMLTFGHDLLQRPDPRYPHGPPFMMYFRGIDEDGNLWGSADLQGAYLHNGTVSFAPGTWVVFLCGILFLIAWRYRTISA